jgi:hypothetical protein
MIGGPLNAVVKAQAQSAQTSVDFIKSIGFNAPDAANDPGESTSQCHLSQRSASVH